jgi:hypothetical protein
MPVYLPQRSDPAHYQAALLLLWRLQRLLLLQLQSAVTPLRTAVSLEQARLRQLQKGLVLMHCCQLRMLLGGLAAWQLVGCWPQLGLLPVLLALPAPLALATPSLQGPHASAGVPSSCCGSLQLPLLLLVLQRCL